MARLESASRLRPPRRIMVSMTSLRKRLAAAPSPSSPVRSRYSQAIWKDSSSNWEREIVMGGKRTRTARVPFHLRFAARFPSSIATGSDRKTTSPNTWASGVSRDRRPRSADLANRVRRRRAGMRSAESPPPCPLRLRTGKRNTWTSHSSCESESLLCVERPEPPSGRKDSSRQERSQC
jgi:hypothetical protein